MYYEEKIINGVLHTRTNPYGEWCECSKEGLTERLIELRATISKLENKMESNEDLLRSLKSALNTID